MVRDRRDDLTISLLDWQPPEVAVNVDVAAHGDLSNRIARIVSHALRECSVSREVVAQKMSDYLDRTISLAILEKYASEASAIKLSIASE